MRTFRFTTTACGKDYVDFFNGNTVAEAKALYDAEAYQWGLPEDRTVAVVEVNPDTLRPINIKP